MISQEIIDLLTDADVNFNSNARRKFSIEINGELVCLEKTLSN